MFESSHNSHTVPTEVQTACLLITVTSLLRHSNTQRLAAVTGAGVRPTVCQAPANFPHQSLAPSIRWFRRRSGIGNDSDFRGFRQTLHTVATSLPID
jgi:hypothetical protein